MVKQDIKIRKAVETDLEHIEKLYEAICDYLETHRNYPGWKKVFIRFAAMPKKG